MVWKGQAPQFKFQLLHSEAVGALAFLLSVLLLWLSKQTGLSRIPPTPLVRSRHKLSSMEHLRKELAVGTLPAMRPWALLGAQANPNGSLRSGYYLNI